MKKFFFFIAIVLFQINYSQGLSESFLKESAKLIIDESKTCIFNTIDKSGGLSSRIMDPFVTNNGFIVYLVTNPKSRKVQEIKNNPRVSLTFQNKSQEKNLIEVLKQNCKKIVRKRTGKKPYTNINIARI